MNKIAHKDRAHSSIGGSSAKRVLMCPGSVSLCEKYPNEETDFAAEGTALHEAVELILTDGVQNDEDVIGLTFNGYKISEDLFEEAVEPALGFFDQIDRELGGSKGIEFINEARVIFPGISDSFGTVDIVGLGSDRTIILDWKFGAGVAVSAHENAQLMYYAYAAAHTKETEKFFHKDRPIEMFIVQPRTIDGEPFTRWMTSYNQLEAFALELRKAAKMSAEPNAPMKMGEWCRFCNGKMGCPLYHNQVAAVQGLSQDELAAEFEKWAPMFDIMAAWGKDCKDLMHQEMEKGLQVRGYKLVNKRATRKWTDEEKALAFMARHKVPAADRFTKKILSPPQAEKALKKFGVTEFPEGLVKSESSGTTVAPESDNRPAVVVASEALRQISDRLKAGGAAKVKPKFGRSS